MKSFIIDTGALALFFDGDKRVAGPFSEIERGVAAGLITSPGLAEFYYKTCQKLGRDVAGVFFRRTERRLTMISPEAELAVEAGREKCKDNELSLVDCFALALTKRSGGTLLTTDGRLGRQKGIDVKYFEV